MCFSHPIFKKKESFVIFDRPALKIPPIAVTLFITKTGKGWITMNEKKTSTFSKITKIVIWMMLILTVGGVVLTALMSFM